MQASRVERIVASGATEQRQLVLLIEDCEAGTPELLCTGRSGSSRAGR